MLPPDPYEQLNLAHRITCRAYSQRVASLEGEAGRLRQALDDRAGHARTLEARLASCQLELRQALDKVRVGASSWQWNPDNHASPSTSRVLAYSRRAGSPCDA